MVGVWHPICCGPVWGSTCFGTPSKFSSKAWGASTGYINRGKRKQFKWESHENAPSYIAYAKFQSKTCPKTHWTCLTGNPPQKIVVPKGFFFFIASLFQVPAVRSWGSRLPPFHIPTAGHSAHVAHAPLPKPRWNVPPGRKAKGLAPRGEEISPSGITYQWDIPIFNRKYIFIPGSFSICIP